MKSSSANLQNSKDSVTLGKQRTYSEIVEFLDMNWNTNTDDKGLTTISALDKILGFPSKKLNSILIGGTNGKSLTLEFTRKILMHEELSVGTLFAPHILTYNERFAINNEYINNKNFAELANQIINVIQAENLNASTRDILTAMAFTYFAKNNVDVALFELEDVTVARPVVLCTPHIIGITRITNNQANTNIPVSESVIDAMLSVVKKNTHVVSADQSKLNLQAMQKAVLSAGGIWSMPIRKLATLAYPFEQLHGRCAALAERIAQMYINIFVEDKEKINSLLAKKKGQRGRPTLEAKRASEINPKKTIDQFWKETENTLYGRFELLDKEKPTILLDNASNLDAFKNLLLGIRLLHYRKQLKGLTIILGCNNPDLDVVEFTKTLRYFFKKTSGQIIIVPVESIPGDTKSAALDAEKLTNDAKSMNIKARSAKSIAQAFEYAAKSVDDRNGLVVVTGSSSIISEYWRYKGIKRI